MLITRIAAKNYKTYKDLDSRIKKQFPGKEYGVVDYDDNEATFLVILQSDKLYGTYYEYNTKTYTYTKHMIKFGNHKIVHCVNYKPDYLKINSTMILLKN